MSYGNVEKENKDQTTETCEVSCHSRKALTSCALLTHHESCSECKVVLPATKRANSRAATDVTLFSSSEILRSEHCS